MYVGICLIIMAMYKSWSCVDGLLLLLLFKVCHILSLRCVTKVTKRVKFDAVLHVLSMQHVLSLRGDKTCRKVHSLHVLSLLPQEH